MSDRLTLEPRSVLWPAVLIWTSKRRRKLGKLVRGHFSFDQKTLVGFVLGHDQLSKIATFSLAGNPCLCSEIIGRVNHSDSGNVFL